MTHALLQQEWDAVIIGTGMGGGTIGRTLAEGGWRVLFIEKGPAGFRSEAQALHSDVFLPEARLLRGFWPEPIRATVNNQTSEFFAPIGAGVGGSSAFYAATLERPEPHDLQSTNALWPCSYDDFAPWYAKAEALFHVSGTPDPLSDADTGQLPPPPHTDPADATLMQELRTGGLHPYHLHSGVRHLKDCASCLGRKCPRTCKMDGRSAGVEPALATGNAALLDNAEVVRMSGTRDTVATLHIRHKDTLHELNPKRVILSAGALGSARLMLASTDEIWPNGAANSSDLVGRNLMFHLNEMFALWPRSRTKGNAASKSISFRDLYHMQGTRFGTVQSMGMQAGYGEILHYLRLMIARSRLRHIPRSSDIARIPAAIAAKLFGEAKVFVGLLEDFAYPENRVTFDPNNPGQFCVNYTVTPELEKRRRAFRRAIRRALPKHRKMFLHRGPEINFGHPCGTARFGSDPTRSVLRSDCRSHDLTNLWVVDSSFMPTSFGVNPSLTIAANALRVGHSILNEANHDTL